MGGWFAVWIATGLAAPVQGPEDPGKSLAATIEEHLPEWLKREVFSVGLWQWVGLAAVVVVGLVLGKILSLVVTGGIRKAFDRRRVAIGAEDLAPMAKPLGWLVSAGLWWIGVHRLGLPEGGEGALATSVKFVALASAVWASMRLVDVFAGLLGRRAGRTESKLDDLLIPLVRKSLKVVVFAFGVVFAAENMNADVGALVAGIGIGSLALALAAQDTVRNLFGTLTIVLDQTYHVGDWIRIDDVEGTVEDLGFRSTRVRTFYNSLITVPNGNLINANVDNMGHRKYRRFRTMVSVTYGTSPESIEAFTEGIRELIRTHPYTRRDYFEVYLNAFAPSSLDILVYMFFEAPDWSTELRERGRFMLDILRLARELNVNLAFPTQTLHLDMSDAEQPGAVSLTREEAVVASRNEGRSKARGIVSRLLGDPPRRPPSASQSRSEVDSRGEG